MATSKLLQYLETAGQDETGASVQLGDAVSHRRTIETFHAGGTITSGDVVMWDLGAGAVAGDAASLSTVIIAAQRTLGQPLACGVAIEDAVSGDLVRVVTSGFAVANCAADTGTIAIGDPLIACGVTAGEVEVRATTDVSRVLAVALEAADATTAQFVNVCVYPQF